MFLLSQNVGPVLLRICPLYMLVCRLFFIVLKKMFSLSKKDVSIVSKDILLSQKVRSQFQQDLSSILDQLIPIIFFWRIAGSLVMRQRDTYCFYRLKKSGYSSTRDLGSGILSSLFFLKMRGFLVMRQKEIQCLHCLTE